MVSVCFGKVKFYYISLPLFAENWLCESVDYLHSVFFGKAYHFGVQRYSIGVVIPVR